MKRVLRALSLGLIGGISLSVQAQDPELTQFYAAPVYTNPALAGSAVCAYGAAGRMSLNYRNQWPSLDQSFTSYSAHIEHYLFNLNSGVGLIFNKSDQSMANLSVSEIGATYSYRAG